MRRIIALLLASIMLLCSCGSSKYRNADDQKKIWFKRTLEELSLTGKWVFENKENNSTDVVVIDDDCTITWWSVYPGGQGMTYRGNITAIDKDDDGSYILSSASSWEIPTDIEMLEMARFCPRTFTYSNDELTTNLREKTLSLRRNESIGLLPVDFCRIDQEKYYSAASTLILEDLNLYADGEFSILEAVSSEFSVNQMPKKGDNLNERAQYYLNQLVDWNNSPDGGKSEMYYSIVISHYVACLFVPYPPSQYGESALNILYYALRYNDIVFADFGEMQDELDSNSLRAAKTYEGTTIYLTGYLQSIDSSGKYISIAETDRFSLSSIHCDITSAAQLEKILEMNTDDPICIVGKVTEVGEVLGYYVDLLEIEPLPKEE